MSELLQLVRAVETLSGKMEALSGKFTNLEHLVVNVKESLEREMDAGFKQVNDRFDTQAIRLDRQGALIQTGSRWTNRMNA
jgi:hypothetical protein